MTMPLTLTTEEKLERTEEQLQKLGDAVIAMFDQMIKGNWVDDHGHVVKLNRAMNNLAATVRDTMRFRTDVLGYTEVLETEDQVTGGTRRES